MSRESGAEWLTAREAAELLGVSESTVLNDLKSGELGGRDRGSGRRPRWVAERAEVQRLKVGGGRTDRRGRREVRHTGSADDDSELARQLRAATQDLAVARTEVSELRAEVARLRMIARNANVAVSAQTESLQQFLIELPPND